LICCEGNAVGFKLPEDGVNKYHRCRNRDKFVNEEIQCGARHVANTVWCKTRGQYGVVQDRWPIKVSLFQAVNFSTSQYAEIQTVDFVRLRSLRISYIDLRFSNILNYKSVIIQTVIIIYCNC
jgi:hypothetical protein